MTNAPYAFISRPIPYAERQRVFVTNRGPGITQERTTLVGVLMSIGVLFDDGQFGNAFPADVRPYDDSEPSSVVYVDFPRAKPVEAAVCHILGDW